MITKSLLLRFITLSGEIENTQPAAMTGALYTNITTSITTVACACKTLHYLNLLVAFINHNCQDVFRKYSQNGIAKDWQTMCHIFEEI